MLCVGNESAVSKRRLFTIIITVFCLSGIKSDAFAQDAATQDLQRLAALNESIASSEALLNKYPGNDFAPNLMFQLSELYIKRATLTFQRDMLIYEDAERKHADGLLAEEPAVPQIDFSAATEISKRLLAQFPAVTFRDKVLYRLALCYSEEEKREEAVKYFKMLSEETTDKQLLEESYFRLGEFYFDEKDYRTTIDYYSRLLESWDSPFFDMALYKLGWSYYSVENYTKAISTFIYLIEDINLLDKVDADEIGRSKADLRREAIQYVAVCFSEFGGPVKARDFLVSKKSTDYAEDVLAHLAQLYAERNYYADAITTLRMLIEFYPNKTAAAFYQKQIVENYDLADEKDKADVERAKLVNNYGPGSNWLQLIPAGKERDEIVATAEAFLYQLGTESQQAAHESGAPFDYELAISHYNAYMEKFSGHDRANKVQFYLAECYYELKQFDEAANAYYQLHLNYPESQFSEAAAYNRILAYNNLLSESPSADSADFYLFNFMGKSESGVEIFKALNSRQAQLIQASNDFFVFHRESPRINEVLVNLGKLLFDLEQFKLAEQVYQNVITRKENNPYLPQAYFMIAQSEFRQDKFDSAENWYQRITVEFPDSVKIVTRANKMIASSQFKRAEIFLANHDSLAAAQAFERVAGTAPDSSIAERALVESAKQFEILGDKQKAIALYESVEQKFPKSEFIDDALFKAGLLSEDLSDWTRAATNYLKLYRYDRFSQYAPGALFSAAKSYENLKQFDLARKYYAEYVDAYIQDPERYLEAAFRKGEIAYNAGQNQTALKDFQFVLKAHQKFKKTGISVENYIPANAQFLIAELTFQSFDAIALTPPLRRKLKRKQDAFQEVIKAYTAAAKFKIAEWSTASAFKIGKTFEAFASSLFESPRPKNLTTEALETYNKKLLEQVLPFKQKALEAYEANLKNAEENKIENNWIDETRKRIMELHAELGVSSVGKNEQPGS